MLVVVSLYLIINSIPGWSQYVSEFYALSRQCRIMCQNTGKPQYVPLHGLGIRSQARSKYALLMCFVDASKVLGRV